MAGELAKILAINPYEAPDPSPYTESNSETALAVKAVDNPYAFGHLVGAQMRNKGRQSVYRADLSKSNYLGAENKKSSAEMMLKAGMLNKIIEQPGGMIALKEIFPNLKPLLAEQARLNVSTQKTKNMQAVATSQASGAESGNNITITPAIQEGAGIQEITKGVSKTQQDQANVEAEAAAKNSPVVQSFSANTGVTTTPALPGTPLRKAVDAEALRNSQLVLNPTGGGATTDVNNNPTTPQQQTLVTITATINNMGGTNIQTQFQNDGSMLVSYLYQGKQYQKIINADGTRD